MDAHLNLPRAECLAVATLIRLCRPLPASATPADYERVLRPLYGFFYGVAQGRSSRRSRPASHPSESAWRVLDGAKGQGQQAGPDGRRPGRLPAGDRRRQPPAAL